MAPKPSAELAMGKARMVRTTSLVPPSSASPPLVLPGQIWAVRLRMLSALKATRLARLIARASSVR